MTVDWERYRKCPVCFAPMGEPCTSRSGALVGDRYVADAVTLLRDEPHTTRKPRAGR